MQSLAKFYEKELKQRIPLTFEVPFLGERQELLGNNIDGPHPDEPALPTSILIFVVTGKDRLG